jgi:hypothetical protein
MAWPMGCRIGGMADLGNVVDARWRVLLVDDASVEGEGHEDF